MPDCAQAAEQRRRLRQGRWLRHEACLELPNENVKVLPALRAGGAVSPARSAWKQIGGPPGVKIGDAAEEQIAAACEGRSPQEIVPHVHAEAGRPLSWAGEEVQAYIRLPIPEEEDWAIDIAEQRLPA